MPAALHPFETHAGSEKNGPAWEITIATERQLRETVTRCVLSLDFYFHTGKTPISRKTMVAEAQAVAHLVTHWSLSATVIADCLLRPLAAELAAWRGPVEGGKLFVEFTEVFHEAIGRGLCSHPSPE
jgi:hypothetical protein